MARPKSIGNELGLGNTRDLYFTFKAGGVEYALCLDRMHEVRRFTTTTPADGAAPWVKGIMTLDDGTSFPVIDLLARLGLGQIEFTPYTVIAVLDLGANRFGLAFDALGEVVHLIDDNVQPLATFGADPSNCFVTGFGRVGDRIVSLLDLDVVLQDEIATTRRGSDDDSDFDAAF
ncbi:MAG: chemotaxis protein CheW [Planctomycetes bacterium]|nr:chemotaxis protein CheW [Planctomycetota bacterium]